MADMAESMFRSMEILMDKYSENLEYDKTVKATIIEAKKNDIEYICQYENIKITAYGEANKYKSGDIVYVTVPKGDWKNQLHIVNKEFNSSNTQSMYDPFKNIVNEEEFFNSENQPYTVTANCKTTDLRDLKETKTAVFKDKSLTELFSGPYHYDVVGVRFKVNPKGLVKYNIVRSQNDSLNCTYGIRLKIYDEQSAGNISMKKILKYTSDDMFGNLYGFDDYMYQEVVFDISDLEVNSMTKMQMEFFEKGDFAASNSTEGITLFTYPQAEKDGIIELTEIRVTFGIDSTKHGTNEIVIRFHSDDHLYYWAWPIDKNKKSIDYVVYNKDKHLDSSQINLCYAINDSKEWSKVPEEWQNGNDIVPPLEQLRQDKIRFKYRAKVINEGTQENENEEPDSLYRQIESEEVVCQRYRLSESNLEDDQDIALKLQYQYSQNLNLTKVWPESFTETNKRVPLYETDKIYYVGYDNRLRTRAEAYSPHYIHAIWDPTEPMFKDTSYLAGATITWKIPCPVNSYEQKKIEYEKEGKTVSDSDRITYLSNFFEQNLKTVIMPATEGREYCWGDSVTYELDEDNNFCYLNLTHTFSSDFVYSPRLHKRYLTYAGLPETADPIMKDYFYLSWRFRIKEFYYNSMKYNTIKCVIKKGEQEFPAEFSLDISTSANFQKTNPKMIAEDFEPIAVYYEHSDTHLIVPEQLVHYKSYMEDYSYNASNTGSISTQLTSSLMRTYGSDKIEIKQGYWIKRDGEYVRIDGTSGSSGFNTLIIKPTNQKYEYNFTQLLQANGFEKHNLGYDYVMDFSFSIDSSGYANPSFKFSLGYECTKESYGRSRQDQLIGKTFYTSCSGGSYSTSSSLAGEFTYTPALSISYLNENDEWVHQYISKEYSLNTEMSVPETAKECWLYYWLAPGGNCNYGTDGSGRMSNLVVSEQKLTCNDIFAFKNLLVKVTNSGRSVYSINGIPLVELRDNEYGRLYGFVEGNNRIYLDADGTVMDEGEEIERSLYTNNVIFPKYDKDKYQVWSNSSEIASFNSNLDKINLGEKYNYETTRLDDKSHLPNSFYIGNNKEKTYIFPKILNKTIYTLTCVDQSISSEMMIGESESVSAYSLPSMFIYDFPYEDAYYTDAQKLLFLNTPSVPVTVARYNHFSSDFNVWDGSSVQINKDSVFASAFAAGHKDGAGLFSGVILGNINTVDKDVSSARYGLYGYNKNEKAFMLTEDGKAVFGKEGRGQLLLDGDTAVIQSYRYSKEKRGMKIDFDDGIIDFRNKYNNTEYYMKLDVSDNNINDLSDKPIKIGCDSSTNFSVDWKGIMTCSNAIINGATLNDVIKATVKDMQINGDVDFSKATNVTWDTSKNMRFGHLVCFDLTVSSTGSSESGVTISGGGIDLGTGTLSLDNRTLQHGKIGTKPQTISISITIPASVSADGNSHTLSGSTTIDIPDVIDRDMTYFNS